MFACSNLFSCINKNAYLKWLLCLKMEFTMDSPLWAHVSKVTQSSLHIFNTKSSGKKNIECIKGRANRSWPCLSVTVRLTRQSQNCTVGRKLEQDKCVQTFSRSAKDPNNKPITESLSPNDWSGWNDRRNHILVRLTL